MSLAAFEWISGAAAYLVVLVVAGRVIAKSVEPLDAATDPFVRSTGNLPAELTGRHNT
jgi:hypothetical protein